MKSSICRVTKHDELKRGTNRVGSSAADLAVLVLERLVKNIENGLSKRLATLMHMQNPEMQRMTFPSCDAHPILLCLTDTSSVRASPFSFAFIIRR